MYIKKFNYIHSLNKDNEKEDEDYNNDIKICAVLALRLKNLCCSEFLPDKEELLKIENREFKYLQCGSNDEEYNYIYYRIKSKYKQNNYYKPFFKGVAKKLKKYIHYVYDEKENIDIYEDRDADEIENIGNILSLFFHINFFLLFDYNNY